MNMHSHLVSSLDDFVYSVVASVQIVDHALQDLDNHPVGITTIPCVILVTSKGTRDSPVPFVDEPTDIRPKRR